jgi:hypothetical protein
LPLRAESIIKIATSSGQRVFDAAVKNQGKNKYQDNIQPLKNKFAVTLL